MGGSKSKGRARLAFATVELSTLGDPEASLLKALNPGTAIERYGRLWRMGQYFTGEGGRIVHGRIGFETGDQSTEIWSEERADFVEQALLTGYTAPFAVDLDSFTVCFQIRPGIIEINTFTTNFQALLNEASEYAKWRVDSKTYRVTWTSWLQQVESVVELRMKLRRPNPNWRGRSKLEAIVEGPNAAELDLVFRQLSDGGLNLGDELIEQSLAHAGDNYGSYRAKGRLAHPEADLGDYADSKGQVEYNSDTEGIALVREVEVAEPQAEVPAREIAAQLRSVVGDG